MAEVDVSDLEQDPVVQLQELLGGDVFCVFMCFVVPTLIPWYGWGESLLHGFAIPACLRLVWLYHCTFCVNSIAHLWGDRPYDPRP